jgi:hypothetical protein
MARGTIIKNYLNSVGKSIKSISPGVDNAIQNIPDAAMRTAGRIGRPAAAIGRGLNRVGSSRAAVFGVAAVAGTAGMMSETAPAMQDLAFETAFGDANADRYFTGRDLSSRFLVGSMMGGVGGGILQASSPGDFIATNPTAGMATTALGGVAGAAIGGTIGSAMSRGFRGAVVGGALGAAGALSNRLSNNRQFYTESPYSVSGSTAASLNATGDIVLGMHNSRRGY